MLKGPRNREGIVLDLNGSKIAPTKTLIYLGIHLDTHGIFGKHILEATAKADRVAASLARVMPNIRGSGVQRST